MRPKLFIEEKRAVPSGAFFILLLTFRYALNLNRMETLQLAEELNALPERTRAALERLVLLLKKQAAEPTKRQPPILYPADLAQEGQPFSDPEFFGSWADRTDITDGADYIHQVRRGLRPA